MANKYCAQAGLVVEVRLERKDAEHQIEEARHLFDAATIPSPDLWADIVNYFLVWRLLPQCAREAQIKPRVVDQHDRVRFALFNFLQCFAKLLSKITVFPDYFPQTKDSCVADPIFELLPSDDSHLRAATPYKVKTSVELAQRTQQRRPMIIRAHFSCDKIDRLGFHLRHFNLQPRRSGVVFRGF